MDEAWLNTVRVARTMGDISSLFPPGIKSLLDLPYTIHQAILNAMVFLSFEELPEKEKPPKSIWLDDEKMTQWFDEVKRIREAEAKGEETSEMTKNPLMDKLKIIA